MPKEELIKLVEALASVGYKIISLNAVDPAASGPPYRREIELKITPAS